MLYIFPNEYEVSWQRNPEAQNELDLRVNFPVDALKEKTVFIIDFYNEFLISLPRASSRASKTGRKSSRAVWSHSTGSRSP